MNFKNKILPLIAISASLFVINACNKADMNNKIKTNSNNVKYNKSIVPVSNGEKFTQTILGNRLANPFTVDNMNIALKNITGVTPNLAPTHRYVRFLPTNQEQIKLLEEDESLELQDYPMDYEVKLQGDYYQDPSIDLENITWLYTAVPIDKELPAGIKTEVLADLFLPDDNNVERYNVQADSLEAEAYILSGNAEEYYGESEDLQTHNYRRTKYYPEGNITIENTQYGKVPMRNVKVKARRWFNMAHTYTDVNGHFKITTGFRGQAHINIKFKSDRAEIRGVRGIRIWEIFDCVYKNIGTWHNSSMQNIQYNIDNSTDNTSEAKRIWVAGMVCNNLEEQYDYATQDGINTPPSHLNIWTTSLLTMNGTGSSPMLRAMSNNSLIGDIVAIFLVLQGNPAFAAIKAIVKLYAPDVTMGYNINGQGFGNTMSSDEIASTIMHEFGHTMHYANVGKPYWTGVVTYETLHFGYGSPTTSGNDKIQLAEGWAEFIGKVYTDRRYPIGNVAGNSNYSYVNDYLEPFHAFPSTYPYDAGGFMNDLTDNGEPIWLSGIMDEVYGYNIKQIYQTLNINVVSISDFKTQFSTVFGGSQQTAINFLYNSYGF